MVSTSGLDTPSRANVEVNSKRMIVEPCSRATNSHHIVPDRYVRHAQHLCREMRDSSFLHVGHRR